MYHLTWLKLVVIQLAVKLWLETPSKPPTFATNQAGIKGAGWLYRPETKRHGRCSCSSMCGYLCHVVDQAIQVILRCCLVMFLLQSRLLGLHEKTCINGSWTIQTSSIQFNDHGSMMFRQSKKCLWNVQQIGNPSISASTWHLKFNGFQLNTQGFIRWNWSWKSPPPHKRQQGISTTIGPFAEAFLSLYFSSA